MTFRKKTNQYSKWERQHELLPIAIALMEELISAKKETFILLKNDDVRKWWDHTCEINTYNEELLKKEKEKEAVIEELVRSLPDDELQVLGLLKYKKKKK